MSAAFLTIFPGCEPLRESAGGLESAEVESVNISEAELAMTVDAKFTKPVAPAEISALESSLRAQYGLLRVTINAECPKPVSQQAKPVQKDGKLLYGKPLRKGDEPVDMSSVTLESGFVTVKGEVFAVNNR